MKIRRSRRPDTRFSRFRRQVEDSHDLVMLAAAIAGGLISYLF